MTNDKCMLHNIYSDLQFTVLDWCKSVRFSLKIRVIALFDLIYSATRSRWLDPFVLHHLVTLTQGSYKCLPSPTLLVLNNTKQIQWWTVKLNLSSAKSSVTDCIMHWFHLVSQWLQDYSMKCVRQPLHHKELQPSSGTKLYIDTYFCSFKLLHAISNPSFPTPSIKRTLFSERQVYEEVAPMKARRTVRRSSCALRREDD